MKIVAGLATLSLAFARSVASGACRGETVVKRELFEGMMTPGSIILVDDGTCGRGKIKKVTGGEIRAMNPRPRLRRCIPRDKKMIAGSAVHYSRLVVIRPTG